MGGFICKIRFNGQNNCLWFPTTKKEKLELLKNAPETYIFEILDRLGSDFDDFFNDCLKNYSKSQKIKDIKDKL